MALFSKFGTITKAQGAAGFTIASLDGESPATLIGADYFAGVSGLPPSDPTSAIQVLPGDNSDVGADINGNIGAQITYINTGNDIDFTTTGAISPVSMGTGFYSRLFYAIFFGEPVGPTYEIDISVTLSGTPLGDLTESGAVDANTGADVDSAVYDDDVDRQTITLTWTTAPGPAKPTVVSVVLPGPTTLVVGTVPAGQPPTLTFTLPPGIPPGTISIITNTIIVPNISPPTTTPFTIPTNIMSPLTLSGGIDLGGTMIVQALTDPSGVYTLVPGKRSDTLYDRIPAEVSVEVKIPDPYIKTSFVGE